MRIYLLPIGLALLLAYPAHAEATPLAPELPNRTTDAAGKAPLTLPQALRTAFEANPGLRAAQRDIGIAAGQRQQAGSFPNPELAFSSEGLDRGRRTRTVQLNQPIELGGKRTARIMAADVEGDIASAELADVRNKLRAEVTTAFYEVVVAQERQLLAESSAQLAHRVTDATARRVIAGRVSPVEETKSRVAEASSKIERVQAANELSLAQRRLAASWGDTVYRYGLAVIPEEEHYLPSAAELLKRLETSPQMKRARLNVEHQQALTQVERRKAIPDLTLSIGKQSEEQFGQPDHRQTVVGLSIPLPLFDRNRGNVLSGLRRTEKAQDELAATETRLSVELMETYSRFENAHSELTLLRSEVLPGATSAYEAAVKGFELGKFNFVDVLDAQRTLFQAKAQYLRALGEAHRARADVERLVGPMEPSAIAVPLQPNILESK